MKERRFKKSSKNGITLIALIITIVVMCILVGVSIGIVMKKDYFGKAEDTIGKANAELQNQVEQEEEIKNAWEETPGQIIKSETKRDTTITIRATTSSITRTSFRVNATGTNANGDILTFTLKVGDTTYEAKTGEEVYWDITGLEPGTAYKFEVIATDNDTENSVIGREETLANNRPTITVDDIEPEQQEATITAHGTDKDGDALNYSITVKEPNGTVVYTSGPNTTSNWNVTGLTYETTYNYEITVNDGFDTVTKTGDFTTKPKVTVNTPPTFNSYSCTGRTTNSLTITANATDAEQTSLIYTLYTCTTQSGTYTQKAQTTGNSGKNVTLKASSLSQYTVYYWYVTVTDGTNTVKSDIKSSGTECPGTGNTCSMTRCSPGNCEYCGGDGTVYCGQDASSWDWEEEYNYKSTHSTCGGTITYSEKDTCAKCGAVYYGAGSCENGDYTYPSGQDMNSYVQKYGHCKGTISCKTCSGDGWRLSCSQHGYSTTHYYCTSHSYSSTSSSHSYCSHGYTSSHYSA